MSRKPLPLLNPLYLFLLQVKISRYGSYNQNEKRFSIKPNP